MIKELFSNASELILHRKRRFWNNTARSHFEIKDISAEQAVVFAQHVKRELERRDGVEWATVNPALRRVVVAHDVSVIAIETLDRIISAVELEMELFDCGFLSPSNYPGDDEPQLRSMEAKRRSIEATAGYLTEADDDFIKAVEKAGLDVPNSHEW